MPHFEGTLKVIHSPTVGIVPSENKGIENASGEIVVLIDDDAVPPKDWLAKHLRHYNERKVGAVGGPAFNHHQNGDRFAVRPVRQIGKLAWYGKFIGNLNDSILKNKVGPLVPVDGLAANNMSLRRVAFHQFETSLKNYWQHFELEACQQIKLRGFQVLFDFDNPVLHYPASENKVYDGTREGDLIQKFYNGAYNHSFILSKYTHGLLRYARLFYLFVIGSVPFPGPVKYPLSVWRYGYPRREFQIMLGTLTANWRGWRDGTPKLSNRT
jgi:GT2 family glycosyltransferase